MKLLKIILIIIGLVSIFINALSYIAPSDPAPTVEFSLRIGYYMGRNFLFILGSIFLLAGYIVNRKIRKKKRQELIDSF